MNSLKAKSRQKGFTLIELTITLTLITLLASALIYSWKALKEKAAVAHGVQGAGCLQTALVGLDALEPAEQDEMTHRLSGASLADFNAAAEELGCRLGPTAAFPNGKQVLVTYECVVIICQGIAGEVISTRTEPCASFTGSSLRPSEYVCGRGYRLRVPTVPNQQILMSTEDSIRVVRVSAPPIP